ncbi:MAG: hypothetical protein ACKESC_00100 [Candidatus Hodgkinia cicadicola]
MLDNIDKIIYWIDEYWVSKGCVKLNSCRKLGASTLHSEAIQYVVKTSIGILGFAFATNFQTYTIGTMV